MHIPDSVLSNTICTATATASLAAIAISAYKIRKNPDHIDVKMLALVSAFVFGAQMLNFPVTEGTSGHFIGAALLTFLFGPAVSILAMSVILSLQCFIFADGGVTALGANIFNMAVVTSLVASAVKTVLGEKLNVGLVVMIGAYLSILAAALACSFQLVYSGFSVLPAVLDGMLSIHNLIAGYEALITFGSLYFIALLSGKPMNATGVS